jgi:HAAS
VSRSSHGHELVRSYLSELDAALRGVPAAQARELREQIVAHLDDALSPEAGEEQVTAVLGRLGSPGDLAADLGQAAVAPLAALGMTRAWLRRRLAQVRRRTWSVAGVLVALAGIATGYLIYYYVAPGPLQDGHSSVWWYPRDGRHEVVTTADGVTQATVPIRSGQRQGFAISIYNPTGVTQTILGPAYGDNVPWDSPASETVQIGVSVPNREIDTAGGVIRNVGFTLPGAIPPHQRREVRVLWISDPCIVMGDTSVIDTLSLRVRVGWFTRTEIIPLDQGWAVAGTSQGLGRCS